MKLILHFPKSKWINSGNELIRSDSLRKMLIKYEINENSVIIDNPFSICRVNAFLYEANKTFDNRPTPYAPFYKAEILQSEKDCIEMSFTAHNFVVKLTDGVSFMMFEESYMNERFCRSYIIFDPKIFPVFNQESFANFIFDFSKKISTMTMPSYNRPNAFDGLFLEGSLLTDIRSDLEAFLDGQSIYKEDLGVAWKRGYMLIGPPGNGKTMLIRKICEYYGLGYYDIAECIQRNGTINIGGEVKAEQDNIDEMLFPYKSKPVVCVLEDLDKLTAFQSGVEQDHSSISLHALLKGIDGVDQHDGVILIATTNFPDVLHEALTGRPGRFDKIYRIDKPGPENVRKLLEYYKITIPDDGMNEVVEDLVKSETSMAFVAEFVKSAKMLHKRNNITMDEAKSLLKEIHRHQKLCTEHFKDTTKSFGFRKD